MSLNLIVHPWIGSNPPESVERLKQSAYQWNLASTITTIGMGAISFSVTCASLFVPVPVSITLLAIVVITPLLSFATSYFKERTAMLLKMIEHEAPVADEYKNILLWDDSQILLFLNEHHIQPPKDIPLRNLLPLIARYRAKCLQAVNFTVQSQHLLVSENVSDRAIRLWQRLEGWRYREEVVIPANVEAAFVLAILHNPQFTGSLTDHFIFIQKTFAERMLDRIYDREDHYLKFCSQNKEPIPFETLYTSDPQRIYELLYG